jgi:hypothetical protein
VLPVGLLIRGTLVWSACPELAPGTIELADLDLGFLRLDPASGPVPIKWSVSLDHGVETVTAFTLEPGVYFFRIRTATSTWPDCGRRSAPGTLNYGFAYVMRG